MEGEWLSESISSSKTWGEKLHSSVVTFNIPHLGELLKGENERDLLGLGQERI